MLYPYRAHVFTAVPPDSRYLNPILEFAYLAIFQYDTQRPTGRRSWLPLTLRLYIKHQERQQPQLVAAALRLTYLIGLWSDQSARNAEVIGQATELLGYMSRRLGPITTWVDAGGKLTKQTGIDLSNF